MSHNPEKMRLDALLVSRGLFESREKAQRALMAGIVDVAGRRGGKPGDRVTVDIEIVVHGGEKYVSRGGLKLEAALQHFGVDPTGRVCLDVGASTGGFTDCLLQAGAARVHALDVGHNQMHWKIRSDSRVVAREGINCRHLTSADIGDERVWLAVADVSFISLTLIIPPALALLESGGSMIVLIKPQFELSRDAVGKGGIVSDPAAHAAAIEKIRTFVSESGHHFLGVIDSPILGTTGNREFLAHIRP